MPILPNPRHELFAQEIAKGASATQAYGAAGYKRRSSSAAKLWRQPEVRARVVELAEASAQKAGVTIEAVVEELARIGFSNMLDYLAIGEGGDPIADLSRLSRDKTAAIAELNVRETREGRRVTFKLHDKKGALVSLGRHIGMFPNKLQLSGPNGAPLELITDAMTPREAAEAYAKTLEE